MNHASASTARAATSARLLVVSGAVLWGTTGTAQALGPPGTSPVAIGGLRIAMGALALLALAMIAGPRGSLGRGSPAGGWPAAVIGAAAVAGYQACFFAGVARTGVAVGTVVAIGSAPVFTGGLGRLVLSERPERGWGAATVLAVAGCALLTLPGGDASADPVGVLLALGAGLAYAIFALASRRLLAAGGDPVRTMALLFAGGALLLLPMLAFVDLGWVTSASGLIMILWLGLAATALAYVLFARGLRGMPAATATTLTLAEPLTAAILGLAILAERPGWLGFVGAALVFAGLAWLSVRPRLPAIAG